MSEPTGHLDLDALADHLAGEVDASDHLVTCAGCTARLGELEAAEQMVLAALASLPAPAVPDDVAARLLAAFSQERVGVSTPADAADTGTRPASATVTPIRSRRSSHTVLSAAAAGVLLLSGGAIGLSLLGNSSSDQSTADSAAGATALSAPEAAAAGFPTVSSGIDYADAPGVSAGLPAVLAGTAPEERAAQDSAAASSAAEPAPVADDPLGRLRTPEGLADCLTALLPPEEPDVRPLAVDYASYDGTPALAVVLPDPDPAKVSVFVVGAGCTQAEDGTLFFTRLDRP